MSLRRFKMEKLVRDKIPEMLEKKGAHVVVHSLSSDELLHHLKLKLKEEAEELSLCTTKEDFKEEIADIAEILRALAKCHDFDMKDIEETRRQKWKDRGGFEEGIFMEFIEVETSDDFHPILQYCLTRPKDYPEILTYSGSSPIVADEKCQ